MCVLGIDNSYFILKYVGGIFVAGLPLSAAGYTLAELLKDEWKKLADDGIITEV